VVAPLVPMPVDLLLPDDEFPSLPAVESVMAFPPPLFAFSRAMQASWLALPKTNRQAK
jgi:hypothetical protein